MAIDVLGMIVAVLIFSFIVGLCCDADGNASGNAPKRNTNSNSRRNSYHSSSAYCECPSCGAPFYDGYCEECGYPDINQGWIGENY